jgi:hypothetical protein
MVGREEPDLLVVKFSWARERQNSRLIRGANNPGGPITTPIPSDNQDLGSRRAEIRTLEKKAAGTSGEPPRDSFQFRLEVKNTGTNVVKSLVWEFKPTAGPDDYEPIQYLCALRVKQQENKSLDLWTPYAPVKVINVDARANGLKDGAVIINKIEYEDGSVWKRRGWYYQLPADASQKLSEGKCSVFSI